MTFDWWVRVRNAGRYFSTDFAARAAVFATLVYAARVLGPAEFGEFALVYTAAQVAVLVADMGLTTLLLRRGARSGRMQASSFWTAVSLKLGAGVASSVCLVGAFLAFHGAGAEIAAVYGPTVVLLTVTMSLESLAIASSRPDLVGGSRLAGNASVLALTVPLLSVDQSAVVVALAFLGGGIVKACWILYAVRHVLPTPLTARRRLGRPLLRRAAPFYGSALAVFLYQRVDVLMLGALASVAVAVEYVAAYRVLDGVLLLPAAVCAAFLPSWAARRRAGALGTARPVILLLACVGVLVGVELIVMDDFLINTLYGDDFDASASILTILALSVPLSYVNIALVWFAYLQQKEAKVAVLGLFALFLNVALNLVLIPALAGQGAAAATVTTEALISMAYLVLLGIHSRLRRAAGRLTAATCGYAGALAFTAVLCIGLGAPWFASAAAVAFAGMLLLFVVYKREVAPLLEVTGRP